MKKERKIRIFQFSREFCLLIYFFLLSNIFVSFFFFFVFIQNRYWSSRASNGIYSNQRSDPRYSYRLQQYSTRSEAILFFQASFERKIIERESIIPLTDNNFSLKSLIFLKHFHPRFKYFLEPTPFVHALVSSPRDDRISSHFFTGSTRRCCVKGKNVCIYI